MAAEYVTCDLFSCGIGLSNGDINDLFHFLLVLRISKNIPTTKDVEPLLEIDGDVRNFEVFLASRTPVLVARDVKTFLPCTVNLDPKLREIIAGGCPQRQLLSPGALRRPRFQELYTFLLLRETPRELSAQRGRPGAAGRKGCSFAPFLSSLLWNHSRPLWALPWLSSLYCPLSPGGDTASVLSVGTGTGGRAATGSVGMN